MKSLIRMLLISLLIVYTGCQETQHSLTEDQVNKITTEATEVVQKVFDYSNNMDFESGLNHYSETADSYFITDGIMHNLDELKKAYKAIGPSVEDLENTIESWNVNVLSEDVVTFTLPVQLRLKLKEIPEYTGNLIWTATLQKQNDEWKIIQSHESWLNCAEVSAALSPSTEN